MCRVSSAAENTYDVIVLGGGSTGENVADVFNMQPFYEQVTTAAIRDAARMYLNTNRYVKVTLMPVTN